MEEFYTAIIFNFNLFYRNAYAAVTTDLYFHFPCL